MLCSMDSHKGGSQEPSHGVSAECPKIKNTSNKVTLKIQNKSSLTIIILRKKKSIWLDHLWRAALSTIVVLPTLLYQVCQSSASLPAQMSLRQSEENCGLNPQRQREHLTASKHIYIVLHEQWTGLFRPPLTQQSMKHKEVAAGQEVKEHHSAHADNLGIILPSVFCHSTWGISFLMHYSRNMSCTAAVRARRRCTWNQNQILMRCFYIQYWCWSLSFLHWLSPQCAKKESIYQRNWSWTTGLINKVIMLEAFRWEIINITFIASRPVLFISWIIKNRWGN